MRVKKESTQRISKTELDRLNCEATEHFLYRILTLNGKAEAKKHKDTNKKLEQE